MLFDIEYASKESAAAKFDQELKRARASPDWEVRVIPGLGQAAYVRTSSLVEVHVTVLSANKIVDAGFQREDVKPMPPISKELLATLISVAASATRMIGRHPENMRSIETVPAPQPWVDPRTGVAPPQITR